MICGISQTIDAQVLKDIRKAKEKIAGLTVGKLSRDPITTSFKDVDKKRYLQDGYGDNETFANIFDQEFVVVENGFRLAPGYYEGEFQSFCIKAGTVAPNKGSGRFYAAMKGPKQDIFETILSALHNDRSLKQREVQLLLWAIIAKTDFHKMKGPVKVTALKILSAKEISRLSKGALDGLARDKLNKLSYKSEALRAVIDAENNLRRKYYRGAKTYAEYEDVAMIAGVEPVVSGWEQGRWIKHPDGYYLRYYPTGYWKTRTQIYVPEESGAVFFNGSGDIGVPPGGGQRLLQTNLPYGDLGIVSTQPNQDNDSANCDGITNTAADAAIMKQMIMQNIPGVAVAVFQNGKITHINAYGYSNTFEKTPITKESIMHWASISKSVTAVAAMQLDLDETIDYEINDLVKNHCDYWPPGVSYTATDGTKGSDYRHDRIRVQHLLQNRSGINHYGLGRLSDTTKGDTTLIKTSYVKYKREKSSTYVSHNDRFNAESSVKIFNQSVLNFEPGRNYNYTSFGYNLLGATIEEASPNGYVSWVKQNIRDVANMQSFQIAKTDREGHTMRFDGLLKIGVSRDKEWVLPSGGWESNICDLAKYAIGLAQGDYFDQSKISMWDANNSTRIGSSRYGYGTYFKYSGTNFMVYHGGKHGNHRSFMHFFPSDSTGIVIMAPAVYADLPTLARNVYNAMGIRNNLYGNVKQKPLDYCRTDMKSNGDMFNGVWRKSNEDADVLIRTGLTHKEFYEEYKRLKSAGYYCSDFEAYVSDKVLYWDGIFKKGSGKKAIWRNYKRDAFIKKYKEMIADGYRLTDLETYKLPNGQRRWAGLFEKASGGYALYTNKTYAEFADIKNDQNTKGRRLIDIEVYEKDNQLLWSGIWRSGKENFLTRNMTIDEFKIKNLTRRAAGYRILDVEHYLIGSSPNFEWRVAAIWEKSNDDEIYEDFNDFCDMGDLQETHSNNGYELIDWERMEIDILD